MKANSRSTKSKPLVFLKTAAVTDGCDIAVGFHEMNEWQ